MRRKRQTWNAHHKLCFLINLGKKCQHSARSRKPLAKVSFKMSVYFDKTRGNYGPHKWMLDKCNRKIINSNSWSRVFLAEAVSFKVFL